MKQAVTVLTHLCGVAAAACALFSTLIAFPIFNQVTMVRNAGGYAPGRFHVDKVVYSSGRKLTSTCYAEGRVRGQAEKLSLSGCQRTDDATGVRAPVAAGQEIEVLYNPALSTMEKQGEYLRVRQFEPDFVAKHRDFLRGLVWFGYRPFLLTAVAFLLFLGLHRVLHGAGTFSHASIYLAFWWALAGFQVVGFVIFTLV